MTQHRLRDSLWSLTRLGMRKEQVAKPIHHKKTTPHSSIEQLLESLHLYDTINILIYLAWSLKLHLYDYFFKKVLQLSLAKWMLLMCQERADCIIFSLVLIWKFCTCTWFSYSYLPHNTYMQTTSVHANYWYPNNAYPWYSELSFYYVWSFWKFLKVVQ